MDTRRAVSVFEKHARLTIAGLVLVAMVGSDLAFTGLYRWAAPGSTPQTRLRVRSDVYHHGLAPLLSLDAERWGPGTYPYRTNSLGFRDRAPLRVPLVPAGRRIVFMGDSFTEGVGVPYEKTFVGIVDGALGREGVEVLNAAVSLYSPTLYYRKTRFLLEDVGLRFDELVVFIDVSDIQDEVAFSLDEAGNVALDPVRRRLEERENARYSSALWRLHGVKRFLDAHTLLLGRLFDALDAAFTSERHRGGAWTLDAKVFDEYGREGLAHARARMDALHALLLARGIRLTIAVYPWTDQILAGDRDSRQVHVWREWAAEKRVGFVDCFPDFLAAGPARDVVKRFFIPGDIHWNDAGHRLVADRFLKEWTERASR